MDETVHSLGNGIILSPDSPVKGSIIKGAGGRYVRVVECTDIHVTFAPVVGFPLFVHLVRSFFALARQSGWLFWLGMFLFFGGASVLAFYLASI